MKQKSKILTNEQVQILEIFSSIPASKNFYFSGATALSEFYLQHRLSFDIDLFAYYELENEKDIILKIKNNFLELLKNTGFSAEIIKQQYNFVDIKLGKNKHFFKVNLCFDTAPLIKKVKSTIYGVNLISFEDLSSAKLVTLNERVETRDIIDFYFICKKISPLDVIKYAKRRWNHIDEYSLSILFSRMNYVLSNSSPIFEMLIKKVSAEKIKNFYTEEAINLLKKIKQTQKL